jgi:hypothetical protein
MGNQISPRDDLLRKSAARARFVALRAKHGIATSPHKPSYRLTFFLNIGR